MPPRRAAKPATTPTPLSSCTIAISGSIPSYTQAAVKSLVEKLGASVASKVNDDTTHLVTTPFDFEKNTTKVKDATKRGIPIVEVSWLEECDSKKTRVKEDAHVVGQSAQNGAPSQGSSQAATPASVVKTDSTDEDAVSTTVFKGCVIALSGRLTRSQRQVGDLIQEYGGDVVKAVDTDSATHLITTQAVLKSNGAEIQAARKKNIPILAEYWIDDSIMALNTDVHTQHLLDPSQARSVITAPPTTPAVAENLDLFEDCVIVVSGSVPGRSQKDAVALIKEYGGESPAGVPKFMTHLVTTEAEIEKKTAKVRAALDDPDVYIVSFDWLDYCINMMQKGGETHHNLRPGSQTKKRSASPDTAQVALPKRQKVVFEDEEEPQADAEDDPAAVQSGSRSRTKRQIPDMKAPGCDSYEVHEDNGVKYDVVLTNRDRYYRIQVSDSMPL
jgi:NAD-dependent DNA ligase